MSLTATLGILSLVRQRECINNGISSVNDERVQSLNPVFECSGCCLRGWLAVGAVLPPSVTKTRQDSSFPRSFLGKFPLPMV